MRDLLLGARANVGPSGVQAEGGGHLDGITQDGSGVVYGSFTTNWHPAPGASRSTSASARATARAPS